MTQFTRQQNRDGIYTYTFVDDPRFTIEANTRATTLGTGAMVFGQIAYGDGRLVATDWYIRCGGKRFGGAVSGRLRDQKTKVLDPEWREWALERAAV